VKRAAHDPGRVPTPSSSLFGRSDEIARVRASLEGGAGLLSLVGPPGVGKTRLALEVARTMEARFCAASEARTGFDVVMGIATAFGVPLAAGADEATATAQSGYAIASMGPVLLVLDNVEQVVADAARVIRALRAIAGQLRLLVTSREALDVEGELVFCVEPLDAATGTELFVARAQAVAPSFRAEGKEREAITEIVQRLDGLPLAIELAAPRLRVIAPTALLAHVSRQLDLLRSPRDGRPARHASLRAALAWSWELLSAEERDALSRLALFVGPFPADAAARVIAPERPATAVHLIEALERRSLLSARAARAGPELVLLDSVREFALAEGRGLDLSDAVKAHARLLAERLESGDPAHLADALAAHDRCLAIAPELAVRIALGVERTLSESAPVDRRLGMLDRTIEVAEPRNRAELLCARAEARRAAALLGGAFEDARAAAALSEDVAAHAAAIEAQLHGYANRWKEAEEAAARAIALAERVGDRRALVRARRIRGHILVASGAPREDEARRELHRALIDAIALGDRHEEARIVMVLGELEQAKGSLDEAQSLREQALAIQRETGDRAAEGLTLLNLAYTALARLDWSRGAALAREARVTLRELGHRRLETIALICESAASTQERNLERAVACAREAVKLAPGVGEYAATLALVNLAAAEAEGGNIAGARAALDAVRAALANAPNPLFAALLELGEGFYELAGARAARDPGERAELLARARARGAQPKSEEPSDVRVVRGMLMFAVMRAGAAHAPSTLRVERTGRWFERDDCRVALAQRPVLRRLLVFLASEAIARPGAPASFQALIAAGWPDERILPLAATRRLHVTISRLRDLGLRDVLRADPDGYFLDPVLRVEMSD
jgi:predicted ATPase